MKKRLLTLCILGHVFDFLTTFWAKERFPDKIHEANPFFAGLVEKRQWGRVIAVKAAVVGATIYFASKSSPQKEREVTLALAMAATIYWFVVLLNAGQYLKAAGKI